MSWSNTAGYTTELSNLDADTNSNPSYFSSENLSAYQVGAGKKKKKKPRKRTESKEELVERLVKALKTKKRRRTGKKKKPIRKKPRTVKKHKKKRKKRSNKKAKMFSSLSNMMMGKQPRDPEREIDGFVEVTTPSLSDEASRIWYELDMAKLTGDAVGTAVGGVTKGVVRGGITAGQMGLQAGYKAGYNAFQWLYDHRGEIADGTKESMGKMKEFLDNIVLDKDTYIKLLNKMGVDPSASAYPKFMSMWEKQTRHGHEPVPVPELEPEPEPEPEWSPPNDSMTGKEFNYDPYNGNELMRPMMQEPLIDNGSPEEDSRP